MCHFHMCPNKRKPLEKNKDLNRCHKAKCSEIKEILEEKRARKSKRARKGGSRSFDLVYRPDVMTVTVDNHG